MLSLNLRGASRRQNAFSNGAVVFCCGSDVLTVSVDFCERRQQAVRHGYGISRGRIQSFGCHWMSHLFIMTESDRRRDQCIVTKHHSSLAYKNVIITQLACHFSLRVFN